MSTAVVVFTRDLRVHDQPALAAAAEQSERVVPLFVLDDAIVRVARRTALAFLLESLDDLRASLRERGADLIVRRGDPVAETVRVARAAAAARPRRRGRERVCASTRGRAERGLPHRGHRLGVLNTTSIVPPGLLTPAGRDHFRVFTPYRRRWDALPLREPLRAPRRLSFPTAWSRATFRRCAS